MVSVEGIGAETVEFVLQRRNRAFRLQDIGVLRAQSIGQRRQSCFGIDVVWRFLPFRPGSVSRPVQQFPVSSG